MRPLPRSSCVMFRQNRDEVDDRMEGRSWRNVEVFIGCLWGIVGFGGELIKGGDVLLLIER
jgi:hypothetical protein